MKNLVGTTTVQSPKPYQFLNTTARDAYFIQFPEKLVPGTMAFILDPLKSYMWIFDIVLLQETWVETPAVIGPRGEKGSTGYLNIVNKGDWNPQTTYMKNQLVIDSNYIKWLSVNENVNSEPDENNKNWLLFSRMVPDPDLKINDITVDDPIEGNSMLIRKSMQDGTEMELRINVLGNATLDGEVDDEGVYNVDLTVIGGISFKGPFDTLEDIPEPYLTSVIYLVGIDAPYAQWISLDGLELKEITPEQEPTDITSTTLDIGGTDFSRTIELKQETKDSLAKADIIDNTGDGSKVLIDDGTYENKKIIGRILGPTLLNKTVEASTFIDRNRIVPYYGYNGIIEKGCLVIDAMCTVGIIYVDSSETNFTILTLSSDVSLTCADIDLSNLTATGEDHFVNKTGDQTIAGDKTLTGNTIFNGEVGVNGDVLIKQGNMIDLPTDATDPTDVVNKRTLDSKTNWNWHNNVWLFNGGSATYKIGEITAGYTSIEFKYTIIGYQTGTDWKPDTFDVSFLTDENTNTYEGHSPQELTLDTFYSYKNPDTGNIEIYVVMTGGYTRIRYINYRVLNGSFTYATSSTTLPEDAVAFTVDNKVQTINGASGNLTLNGTNLNYDVAGKTTISQAIDNVDGQAVHKTGDEDIEGTKRFNNGENDETQFVANTSTGQDHMAFNKNALWMGDHKITQLGDPTDNQDATNKRYVDKLTKLQEAVKLDEQIVNDDEWAFGHNVEVLTDVVTNRYAPSNTMVLHFNGDTDGTGDCIKCIMDDSGMYVKEFVLQDMSAPNPVTIGLWNSSNPTIYNSGAFYGTGDSYKLTSITGVSDVGSFFDGFGIKGSVFTLANAYEEIQNNSNTIIQIQNEIDNIDVGVKTFNGLTGNVLADGTTLMYDTVAKTSLNTKIDAVNNGALHTTGNESFSGIKTLLPGALLITQGNARVQLDYIAEDDLDAVNLESLYRIAPWTEKLIYKNATVNVNYNGLTLRQWLEGQNQVNKFGIGNPAGIDVPTIPNHFKAVIKFGATNTSTGPSEDRMFVYTIECDPDNLPPLHNVINYCDISYSGNEWPKTIHFTTDQDTEDFIKTVNDTIFDANGYISFTNGVDTGAFPIQIYELSIYAINDTVYTLGGKKK